MTSENRITNGIVRTEWSNLLQRWYVTWEANDGHTHLSTFTEWEDVQAYIRTAFGHDVEKPDKKF